MPPQGSQGSPGVWIWNLMDRQTKDMTEYPVAVQNGDEITMLESAAGDGQAVSPKSYASIAQFFAEHIPGANPASVPAGIATVIRQFYRVDPSRYAITIRNSANRKDPPVFPEGGAAAEEYAAAVAAAAQATQAAPVHPAPAAEQKTTAAPQSAPAAPAAPTPEISPITGKPKRKRRTKAEMAAAREAKARAAKAAEFADAANPETVEGDRQTQPAPEAVAAADYQFKSLQATGPAPAKGPVFPQPEEPVTPVEQSYREFAAGIEPFRGTEANTASAMTAEDALKLAEEIAASARAGARAAEHEINPELLSGQEVKELFTEKPKAPTDQPFRVPVQTAGHEVGRMSSAPAPAAPSTSPNRPTTMSRLQAVQEELSAILESVRKVIEASAEFGLPVDRTIAATFVKVQQALETLR